MKFSACFTLCCFVVCSTAFAQAPVTEPVASMAHMLVREWVGKGELPLGSNYFGADTQVSGVVAARITIRDRGITIGSGEAVAWELGDERGFNEIKMPEQLPLMKLVELATQRAIDDVRRSLDQTRLRAIQRGADPEQVKQQTWDDIGFRLKVDVQLAVDLQPIRRLQGDPPAMVMQRFMPGYHGIWLRSKPDNQPTLVWPADALSGNLSARSQITAAMAGQDLLITELGRLGQPMDDNRQGVDLRRFRVIHSVDDLAIMPPVFLERGLLPLGADAITAESIDKAANILAQHLANRLTAIRGTYRPSGDTYEPLRNTPVIQEHLLACLAMVRYGLRRPDHFNKLLAAEKPNWTHQATARFDALLMTWNEKPQVFDETSRALLLLCLLDWPIQNERFETWEATLTESLLKLTDEQGQWLDEDATDQPMPKAATALATYALAEVYARQGVGGPVAAAKLGGMLDAMFVQVTRRPDLGVLCWTTLAHDAAAEKLAAASGHTDWLEDRTAAFDTLLNSLLTRQVRRLENPRDLSHVLGGMDFKPRTVEGPVVVNWQTGYMLLTLADRVVTLADADNMNAEPFSAERLDVLRDWLLAAQLATRFMMQLQFDKAEAFYVRNLDETLGGVRLSPADNRLTIGPSAVSLLAMTRMLDATRAMRLAEAKQP